MLCKGYFERGYRKRDIVKKDIVNGSTMSVK
jgi:hypothetical protein